MANIKSAQKRIGQSAKRTLRNRGVRSKLRTTVKKHREQPGGAEALPAAFSEIDVAWRKGVIHKNAAARYKSRLAKKGRRAGT